MSTYKDNWDQQYFHEYFSSKRKSLWDVDVSRSVHQDYLKFSPFVSFDLPIYDVGCGIGKEAVYLTSHFQSVVGIDVSKYAIRLAKSSNDNANLHFHVVDMTEATEVSNLVENHGRGHVYMRGVLHQIESPHQVLFEKSLRRMCDPNGKLIINEVSDRIGLYLSEYSESFAELPDQMKQVFTTALPPKGVSESLIQSLFVNNGWELELMQDSGLATNLKFIHGEEITIPSIFVILTPPR